MSNLEIRPRSGVAFTMNKGDLLTVIDPQGEQVADLVARHTLQRSNLRLGLMAHMPL